MTLGDLLNTLASKCGLQQDQALIDLLSSSELAHSEVNDEFARRLDTGLMSLEGAKNNREVLNHLKPIILKAADDKFAVLAEKYGIADAMNAADTAKMATANVGIINQAGDILSPASNFWQL